jgi:RimJ/RimL family protein N-acetyltransferase
MTTIVRLARPADAERIAEFNRCLAEESESKRLAAEVVLAGVRALFAHPQHGRYYVAERGGEIVGQLLVTFEWSDWRNGLFWWIQSVYVAPSDRRSGVFSTIYKHVARLAQQDPSVCGLRLYVEDENVRAQRAYAALGMSHAGYRVMETEFEC